MGCSSCGARYTPRRVVTPPTTPSQVEGVVKSNDAVPVKSAAIPAPIPTSAINQYRRRAFIPPPRRK